MKRTKNDIVNYAITLREAMQTAAINRAKYLRMINIECHNDWCYAYLTGQYEVLDRVVSFAENIHPA